MSNLKTALDNCEINFNQPILVTDLLDEYEIAYEDVEKILQEYLGEEEKDGAKYVKRFVVSGVDENNKTDVLTIANGESKQKEWLRKLKNAESSLYSVQLDGGAKAAAQDLKPVRYCAIRINNIEKRNVATNLTNGNAGSAAAKVDIKTEPKAEVKPATGIAAGFAKQAAETKQKTSTTTKEKKQLKTETTKQTTPEDKKATAKAVATSSSTKKGIINFFAPSTPASAKAADKKEAKASGSMKPPTPKKMQDFFKKQQEKPTPQKDVLNIKKKEAANTSVQLFAEDEAEMEDESSDEEEKLDALKRDIITSEQIEDMEAATTCTNKRRRILDSDDDEDAAEPQQKIEKIDEEPAAKTEECTENVSQSETYLDEEGFVITIKSKKSNVTKKPAQKSPPSSKKPKATKSPMKSSDKTKPSAAPANTKTKQGSLMSFFTKK